MWKWPKSNSDFFMWKLEGSWLQVGLVASVFETVKSQRQDWSYFYLVTLKLGYYVYCSNGIALCYPFFMFDFL